MGRIGDPAALAAIETGVRDPEPEVREAAVFALGLVGSRDSMGLVSEAAADEAPRVRAAAADACARIAGSEPDRVIERLAGDRDAAVRERAYYASHSLALPARLLDALFASLEAESTGERRAAVYALARIGRGSPGGRVRAELRERLEARHALLDLVRSGDPEIRRHVALGLTAPTNDEERRALDLLLADPDDGVRIQAISAHAVPGLSPQAFRMAFTDPNPLVVLAALRALGRMGPDFTNTLIEYIVRDERPWLRAAAYEALIEADPVRASQIANGLSRDLDPGVRMLAARSMIARQDAESLEILQALVGDEDPAVRAAAVVPLANRPGTLTERIGALVGDGDPRVRLALIRAAAPRLKDEAGETRAEALEILERLWQLWSLDRDAGLRLEILDALAEAGPGPDLEEAVRLGLDDRDRRVRRRAARHLRTVYGDIGVAEVAASDRPLELYEDVVRWAERPRAAIVTVRREGFVPGRFTVRLDTAAAPLTCWSFARLAEDGRLDGLPFHRVIPDFLAQTGDTAGNGLGDPGWTMRDEPSLTPFTAGTLGLASPGRDRGGSLWFVTQSMQPHLESRYTAFGAVVQNLEGVVRRILVGDRVVSVAVYEGDGTEPLPPIEDALDSGKPESTAGGDGRAAVDR
jgi:peptidylprolyl isomerase